VTRLDESEICFEDSTSTPVTGTSR